MQQNEEQNQQQTQTVYNPMYDNVNVKPYTQSPNTGATYEELSQRIPEPVLGQESMSREDPYKMLGGGNSGGGSSYSGSNKKEEKEPINPAMSELSDAEMALGAKQMASIILDGYKTLHVFLNKAVQISPKKIKKLEKEGEIDLSVPIPYEYDKTITAGQFIEEFNTQNEETFSVSKEFEKEVTPPLVRVLQKRGAGVTDEQLLIYLFGKDIAIKGIQTAQLLQASKDVIEQMKEYTIEKRKENNSYTSPKPNQSSPPNYSQKSASPSPRQERSEPTKRAEPKQKVNSIRPDDDDDYNFRTNEAVINSTVVSMEMPSNNKKRAMEQREKEKSWGNKPATNLSAYEEALKKTKTGSKKKSPSHYINDSMETIDEAIILSETKNNEPETTIEALD